MREKPEIPKDMLGKWQRVVDILARLLHVPAGLIMKRVPPEHRVFIASRSPDNPYVVGDIFTLDTGLYCDTVMRERRLLLVRDAMKEPEWDRNPDLKHGMVFYLGLPLAWPDGSIFGTICVLDGQTNAQAITYTDLLVEFKGVVESDLRYLVEVTERKSAQQKLRQAHDELESRVRDRTRALAVLNEDLRTEVETRRRTETSLLKRETELEEANAALKVLLRRLEDSRADLEERILANVNQFIFPYLNRLRRRVTDEKGRAYLDILESNVNELTSPLGSHLSARFSRLTPTELEIAKLVMQGKTTKMIAEILNTATSTVDFHRNNIRKKVGIGSARVNLRTYLTSLH
ncbi:MAG: LuxR C-terminal-related transcriptional regulator [Chloroflexota bacterium]|nr:LuxR C-terminal-related transcriptional regulator [Chloroflexota bacterium]